MQRVNDSALSLTGKRSSKIILFLQGFSRDQSDHKPGFSVLIPTLDISSRWTVSEQGRPRSITEFSDNRQSFRPNHLTVTTSGRDEGLGPPRQTFGPMEKGFCYGSLLRRQQKDWRTKDLKETSRKENYLNKKNDVDYRSPYRYN